jgi:hypothetical protein
MIELVRSRFAVAAFKLEIKFSRKKEYRPPLEKSKLIWYDVILSRAMREPAGAPPHGPALNQSFTAELGIR